MQDSFGRTIDYLRLSITDRCNLRCRYCMPEEGVESVGHGDILSYEELVRIAAAVRSSSSNSAPPTPRRAAALRGYRFRPRRAG
ncbi:MAG: hypothetical protein RBR25_13370 [Trichloromonas sp.]|nr:hypothetical protein [Trichloromonas sp.]